MPSLSRRSSRPSIRGFSLGELCLVLFILSLLAAILFPIFAKTRERSPRSCASNVKQIELGFLEYAQDFDGHFPPAAQPLDPKENLLLGWAVVHNPQGEAWEPPANAEKSGSDDNSPMRVVDYIRSSGILICPNLPQKSGPLSYMYNDLAVGASLGKITNPSHSVLVCDGENFGGNVGHAYDPAALPAPATYSPKGTVVLGATMQNAPKRHSGGASYGFVDGHVKWMTPEKVFFPSRFDNSPSHKDAKTGRSVGPDPANEREMAAKGFAATFHLR